MSHADISSDEPASKKARISPGGILNPRESFDTDMNFENNLNDLLPDELGGFNSSTSFEANGSAITNGPSSESLNKLGSEHGAYAPTSLHNGPSSMASTQSSFGDSFIHNPGVTVTSAPINGTQQFGSGTYPNPHPPPQSSSNSVLQDLLLGQAGPRSVPSAGSMHPQRPPGQSPAPFSRSPSVNNVLSPPSMMQHGRHPSGGGSMAPSPYNGTSIVSSTAYQPHPQVYARDNMSMMNRMPNGPQAMPRSAPTMAINGGIPMQSRMRMTMPLPPSPMNRMPMGSQGPNGGFPPEGQYMNGPVNSGMGMNRAGSGRESYMDCGSQQLPPNMIPQSPTNYGPPGAPSQRIHYNSPMPPQMNGPGSGGGMMGEPGPTNMVGPPNVTLPPGAAGPPPPFRGSSGGPGSVGPSIMGNGESGAGTPGGAQDPEKRKLIQQQLVLLLHAHKCQQREKDLPNGQRNQCALPHCSTMKGVLAHMTTCSTGRACNFAHCASSRQIIQHWKNCQRHDCPVCLPLKSIAVDKKGAGGQNDVNNHPLMALAGNGPPSNRPVFSPVSAGKGGGMGSGGPPGHFPGPPSTPGLPQPHVSGKQINLPHDFGPESTEMNKDWHKMVTPDLRNHLVGKLVKAIFPSPDPAAIHDQRIKDLIAYAKKVEREMFECANDREEYYHLLAEKIYKIQKELQEKKRDREKGSGPGRPPPPFPPANSAQVNNLTGILDMNAPPNRTIQPSMPGNLMNMGGPGSNQAAINTIKTELETKPSFGNLGVVKMEDGGFQVKKEEPGDFGQSTSSLEVKQEQGVPPSTSSAPSQECKQAPETRKASTSSLSAVPKQIKVFAPDELRNALMPVWEQLEGMDEAIPFRVPVDPDLLQIPDYFDIIKQPMDLSTIKEKLNTGEYKDPLQFCQNMWLMFDNAWVYNRKNSKVYKYCTKLSDCFTDMINPVMKRLGYCCGERKPFTPLALFCYGQAMCTIARDQSYYCYETSSTQYGLTVSEKYTYCPKCFESLPDNINLSDDPNSTKNLVPKNDFKLKTNNEIDYETYLDCLECGIKCHKICALHYDRIYPGGFVCDACRKDKTKPKPENRFTARRLPHCKLSKHIEDRVNRFLNLKLPGEFSVREQDRKVLIRVLASSDKEVDVKGGMKSRFCGPNGMKDKFPYRTKAIFAFEVIDGVEVCFFGLHVQEYGSNSPTPNARRVYVAYLDSVYYFQPREMRTDVYHQILLGYLEYVKQLNYTMAHIWACPPSEGDDYIFHCHPPEQKIPKPKRLQEWYKKMLDKGIIERTVTDYKDIYKQANDDQLSSPTELPYFEGDFWPNVLEDCIREVDAEEAERRREAEAQAHADALDDPDDETFELQGPGGKGKKKGSSKGQKKKTQSKKTNTKKGKKTGSGTGNELMDKLYTMMEKHKEVFFVIRLHTVQAAANLGPINDPDPLIQSELMDGRDTFLSRAREDHWEFSSLRRAKFSTMCLAHALHEGKDLGVVYTCNTCKNTNAKWHCSTCDDYDLCQACYEKSNHEHEMEQIKQLITDEYSGTDQSKQDNRNESIKRCIQSLVHACGCRDANCKRMSCHKMKRVVGHTKVCKRRQQGSCPVCKQLIALCCYHAKHCKESNCQVPFCQNIRQKLDEQRNIQRRMQDRIMARRINNMYGPAPPPQPGMAPQPPQPQQALPQPAAPQVPYTNAQLPYRPTHPPSAAMMAAQQAVAATSQPGGMVPPPYRPPGIRSQTPGGGQVGSQVPWDHGGGGSFNQPRVSNPNQVMMGGGRVSSFPPNPGRMQGPGRNEVLEERQRKLALISQRLKTAKTPDERNMVIAELKHNPELLAQVINMTKAGRLPAPGGPGPQFQPNRVQAPMGQPGRAQYFDSQRMQVRFPQQQQQQAFQQQGAQSQVYAQHGQAMGGGFGGGGPLSQVRSPPGAQVRSPLSNQYMPPGMGGHDAGQPNPGQDRPPPVMYSSR